MDTTTEKVIEEIVGTVMGPTHSRRQTHYLRESLRHLVRVAKSEQRYDVERCVALSVGLPAANDARKQKAVTRKFLATFLSRQGRLNFQTEAADDIPTS